MSNIIPPLNNPCQVDALTVVFHGASPQQIIEKIFKMDPKLWKHQDFGRYGYHQSLQFGAIWILYDGFLDSMGVCVDMMGQGCRELVQLTGDESIFYTLLSNPFMWQNSLSRIDIALDDRSGLLDMSLISQKIDRGEICTRLQKTTEYKGLADTLGHTVYIGSASSNSRIRIYDKAAQLETDEPWIRVELVLRHESARQFQSMVLEQISEDEPDKNHAIALLGVGVLKDKLSFIEPTNRNISRCPVSAWWEQFTTNIDPVHLVPPKKTIPSLEQASDWAKKQVAPTLTLLFCLLGPDWFDTFLEYGSNRIDAKRAVAWQQSMAAADMSVCVDPESETLHNDIVAEIQDYYKIC